MCHHKHLTWSKQRKGLKAFEIFISSKCVWSGAGFDSTPPSFIWPVNIVSGCQAWGGVWVTFSWFQCDLSLPWTEPSLWRTSWWSWGCQWRMQEVTTSRQSTRRTGRTRPVPSFVSVWHVSIQTVENVQTGLTKAAQINRASLTKGWTFRGGQCFLLGLEHTELLMQERDPREEMPSTNHPQSPLSGGLLCARQVHDDIPHCLLGSCGYNFFLMQVFIMCCFPLCLSKQVILLSANLFMTLFPVYGIIFTWSYQSPREHVFHCYYLLFYITQVVLTSPLQRYSMGGFCSSALGSGRWLHTQPAKVHIQQKCAHANSCKTSSKPVCMKN